MKYCPNCKRDFEDTVSMCRWCETELVSELVDEKSAVMDKLKGEALPEEEADTGEVLFPEGAETETVFTTYYPLQAAEIEAAMKEAGIPVLVRPSRAFEEAVPEADVEAEVEAEVEVKVETEAEIETETEVETEAEVEAEAEEEAPKKQGFFARLFGKKDKKQKADKKEEKSEYRFTKGGMLLDIIVPLAVAEEAYAVLNKTLGIAGATDDWHYEDEATVNEILSESDYDEQDHELDEITFVIDEDQAEDF